MQLRRLGIKSVFSAILGLSFTLLAIQGCDTPDETADYSPEYYGPAIDTRLNIEDISQLEDIIFTKEIPPTDINNNFQGTRQVPAFNLDRQIGPYPFAVTDVFERVLTDTLKFEIRFTNKLPIPLNPETELTFRNQSNDTLIYKHTLQEEVGPGENYSAEEVLTDKLVESNINFYLENVTSAGSDGEQVTFNDNNVTDFEFEIIFLDIEELVVESGKSYTITDTTNVSYTGNSDTSESYSGEIYVFLNNLFPVNFDLQLLFLEEDNTTIDSVLSTRINLEGAPVNQNGFVIGESTNAIDTIPIDSGKLEALKAADQLSTEFQAQALTKDFQGNPVSDVNLEIKDESSLRLQVGTDAKVVVE